MGKQFGEVTKLNSDTQQTGNIGARKAVLGGIVMVGFGLANLDVLTAASEITTK